jgi:hypothetical protein
LDGHGPSIVKAGDMKTAKQPDPDIG